MLQLNKINFASYCFAGLTLMLIHISDGITATSETKAEIQIHADHMKFDMETGSSTYEGAVKITQGNIELSGEKVIIRQQQDEIQQIIVEGQPARYIQDENTENKTYATSQHMQYIADQHRLVMTVDARLEQPGHTIESQRIVYDTKNKVVLAGNNEQNEQGGRVNITLTPKKDNAEPPANTENNK